MGRGEEQRRHFFHPDPRLLLLLLLLLLPLLLLQLPACPPGGFFESVSLGRRRSQTAWRTESTRCCSGRAKKKKKKGLRGPCVELPKAEWRGPISHLRLYAPKRRTFVDINHLDFSFFFSLSFSPPIISFSVKGCTCYPLSGD